MTIEIISWSISMQILDRAWIELGAPGSPVRCASLVRNVTDCAALPCPVKLSYEFNRPYKPENKSQSVSPAGLLGEDRIWPAFF